MATVSEEFTTENIKRRKDEAYLAVTMFDVARRKVYLHTRQEEPEVRGPHSHAQVSHEVHGALVRLIDS